MDKQSSDKRGVLKSARINLSASAPLLSAVLHWEGVSLPTCLQQPRGAPVLGELSAKPRSVTLRCELFGLPGVGKSTLARGLAESVVTAGGESLLLPEAVPYAVSILGISLDGLVPFLDTVNGQAEMLAREAAAAATESYSALVIFRDPAHLQNECYRFVIAARKDGRHPAAEPLAALSAAVVAGRWEEQAAEELGAALWSSHDALRRPPLGGWRLRHLVLTTTDPLEDVAISLARQQDGSRDQRLITGDPGLLAAYLAAIRWVEPRVGVGPSDGRVVLDPRQPFPEVLARAFGAIGGQHH